MSSKTLYLIRHSLPDYPDGVPMLLGQGTDLPLGQEGLELAEKMAQGFQNIPVDRIFSSPLKRAFQTAQAVSRVTGIPVEVCNTLIEMYSGDWEGKTHRQIHEGYPSHFENGQHLPPPNGESDESGIARSRAFLKYVETLPDGSYVAVAHSGIYRILLADLFGIPMLEKRRIIIDFAQVIPIEYTNQAWQLMPGTNLEIRE